jgi:leucyl aminopeptidase (aminopeptidase T)
MNLDEAAQLVITKSMFVKPGERVLIVYDINKRSIAEAIFRASKNITENTEFLETPIPGISGEEPPDLIAKSMLNRDVILIVTSRSLSHTKARRDAVESGARLASLPGITENIFLRTMQADYNEVSKRSSILADILDKGKTVKILTEKGTDITMSVETRKCLRGSGIYNKKGIWGNLPAGEASLAPVEGTTNGILIVDGSVMSSLVKEPMKIKIKDGYAVEFENGTELKNRLSAVGKDAFAVAELGIGTNDKAIITGNVLEDEKVLGTAHIAFGNNISYGGNIDVPVHLDAVFRKPTIYVDGKKIMDNGTLFIAL